MDHILDGKPPSPPKAPDVRRRATFHLVQAIGVPLLALIPLLALFQVFGTTQGEARASDGPLTVEVTHPGRFRYKTILPLEVTVRNTGDTALSGVTVFLETDYVEHFSTVTFTPSPQRVSDEAYVIDLGEIPPGESRVVDGMVQAERYWGASGRITVASDGPERAELEVATFVFP